MADFRTGQVEVQYKPGTLFMPENKEVPKEWWGQDKQTQVPP